MMKLDKSQLKTIDTFLKNYMLASNAADGQKFNPNANVTRKTVGTAETAIQDQINIQLNRYRLSNKLDSLYPDEGLGKEYIRQLEAHEIYTHDESSTKPYCVSISGYPFLLDGTLKLGGVSGAPKHFDSFCGAFVSMVYLVASNFAGAVATVEFLTYLDHFARKDFGDNYLETHAEELRQGLQSVVYPLNEPCAARGQQSVFWNISIFDKEYFENMFGSFVFPDFTNPEWESVDKLQDFFLKWLNKERESRMLTFPVVTVAALTENGSVKDIEFIKKRSKDISEGDSFFVYMSDNADTLSSCCRLRSEITDNDFSFSLGAGGVATGSLNVITINMNRLVQDGRDITEETKKIHKYQYAHKALLEELLHGGLLPVYDAGFISMGKQFLTIGINGFVEAAEYLGIDPVACNPEYIEWSQKQLKAISEVNKQALRDTGQKFNTEFVPAESLGVKHAKWDAADGYVVPRGCYNSYFYRVEDDDCNILDKMELHGGEMVKYLDGGSALHLNLEQAPSEESAFKLFNQAAKAGVNYFCTNVKMTMCNSCDIIDKKTLSQCNECGSSDVTHCTRVIGYLKPIDTWAPDRQVEAGLRHYHKY